MEKMYLVQVIGTYIETHAFDIETLKVKVAEMKGKHSLSGATYRLFVGIRPIGSTEHFKFGTFAKEDVFA